MEGYAASTSYDNDDFYTQAGDLYRLLSSEERANLVNNIVGSMQGVSVPEIIERQIQHFYKADPEYGTLVAAGLGLTVTEEV